MFRYNNWLQLATYPCDTVSLLCLSIGSGSLIPVNGGQKRGAEVVHGTQEQSSNPAEIDTDEGRIYWIASLALFFSPGARMIIDIFTKHFGSGIRCGRGN